MRLKELQRAGFIYPAERGRNFTRWGLTEKGEDVLPILMTLVQFGAKWYANEVFADRRQRTLFEVFQRTYVQKIFRDYSTGTAKSAGSGSVPKAGLVTPRVVRTVPVRERSHRSS